MKKALIRSQGSLKKQSKLILDYKPLESYCPDLIPENKTRVVIYIWDYRIQKAIKHKLSWFLDSTKYSGANFFRRLLFIYVHPINKSGRMTWE